MHPRRRKQLIRDAVVALVAMVTAVVVLYVAGVIP
jgi:hypothetical protein